MFYGLSKHRLNTAKKYLCLFRIKFTNTLQYRAAAAAGVATQFVWGFIEILLFKALYENNADAVSMNFQQLVNYEWLQQSFLALFMLWFWDNDISDAIINGNIAYEFARPVDLYFMWFTKTAASRTAKALLRCLPIIIVASLLPEPYNLTLPSSFTAFILFLFTMIIGLFVVCALGMIVYVLTFFTMSSNGIRLFFSSVAELMCGAVVPLPFFPEKLRIIAELSPFAAVQNLPLRIYSGNISGTHAAVMTAVQILWLIILVLTGKLLMKKAAARVCIQGG